MDGQGTIGAVLSLALLGQALRISIPYVLAALGGTVSERGGIVNIALEGLILTGAFCAVLGTHATGSAAVGLLCAMAGGALVALLHGVVTIRLRANQIISGLAINILAIGLTKYLLKIVFHSSSNSSRIDGLPTWGALASVPVVGDAAASPMALLTVALILAVHWGLYRTTAGLRLRAVGEHPLCAETLGVSVARMRYLGVALSGVLAALGGACLAFEQHGFSDGMSGGRGYIALTAVVFGKWTPLGAALAAVLFGAAEAVQIQLQTMGVRIPTQFVQMIPYVLTIVVLAGVIGRARPPAASGQPYPAEGHE